MKRLAIFMICKIVVLQK